MSSLSFAKSRLIGNSFKYVPSMDASIDWQSMEISEDEYKKNLYDGFFKLKFFEGSSPLIFNCHFLRSSERLFALQSAGLEFYSPEDSETDGAEEKERDFAIRRIDGSNSGTDLLISLSEAKQLTAKLCIDSIEGFEEKVTKKVQGRVSMIRDEFLDDLSPYDLDILEELGDFVLNADRPKKEVLGLAALAYWPSERKRRKTGNDCARCSDPMVGPALRKAWGCDGPSQPDKEGGDRFIYSLGGLETDRCPLALMKEPFVDESARLFCFYEKGKTPNGGALNDETQCYLDTMSTLQRLIFSAQTDYNDYLEEQWTKKDRE